MPPAPKLVALGPRVGASCGFADFSIADINGNGGVDGIGFEFPAYIGIEPEIQFTGCHVAATGRLRAEISAPFGNSPPVQKY